MTRDLTEMNWRKSSYSNNGGQCVEVADLERSVAIRDSKNTAGGMLLVSADTWRRFLAAR